jgi:predicted metal-dependent peptidase
MITKNTVLTKAKTALILDHPFFATIALGLEYIEDKSIKTAETDGECLWYNPDYIYSMDVQQVKALLAHEVLHITNLHHLRRESREMDKWNTACDYAINQILVDSGFSVPNNWLHNYAYKNMNAETIYNLLPNQSNGNNDKSQNGNSQNSNNQNNSQNNQNNNRNQQQNQPQSKQKPKPQDWGRVIDYPCKNKSEQRQKECETMQKVIAAVQAGKKAGKLPSNMERFVDEFLNPVVDWRQQLRLYMTEITRNDYTWLRPSTRYMSQGLYLPKLESPTIGRIILAVDTSGSIDRKMLNTFATEVKEIAENTNNTVTVIYCDAEVQKVEELTDDKLNPKGGGGTDFRPVFTHINENEEDCKVLIYFTDGYCNDFPKYEPDYTTIWAVKDNDNFKPPFGIILQISND